jgi:YesN/AraC family two-component response regulator
MPVTIVVVDDDMDYRLIVRALIKATQGTMLVVGEAADGEEARDVLRRAQPDVLITDLLMPRLNGIELTAWVRRELAATKVILMSSFTEDAYRMMASDSGADAFVNKHVITTGLLPAIKDVVRRISGGSSPAPPTGGTPAPNQTILVVDDEREIREYARDVLEGLGYIVLDSGDPQHALRIVKERPVHLILSDVVMPLMNGLELAKRVEAVSATTKVLLMSGYQTADITPSGRPFLGKPFSAQSLGDKVRDVLARPSAFARPRRPS